MSGWSTHSKGFFLTTVGVLILTPDSLLVRIVGMDPWTMVLWRGALTGVCLLCAMAIIYGKGLPMLILRMGTAGTLVCAADTVVYFSWILALSHTTVANTLIIFSITPLLAALMSVIFLKEHIPLGTWIAIVVGILGIAMVVSDSFIGNATNQNHQSHLIGNLYALLTAIGVAITFVLIRYKKEANLVPAVGLSGIVAAIICLLFLPTTMVRTDQWLPLLGMGLLVLPASLGLITLGARYIPAPEVGFIMLLETVLGPLWVWLALGEQPSRMALLGGVIVITTLAVHAVWELRRHTRQKDAGP